MSQTGKDPGFTPSDPSFSGEKAGVLREWRLSQDN